MRIPTRPWSPLAAASLVLWLTACGTTDDAGEDDSDSGAAAVEEAADVEDGDAVGDGDAVEDGDAVGDGDPGDSIEDAGDVDDGGELAAAELGPDGGPDCLSVDVVAEATGLELLDGGVSPDGGYCTYANDDVIADQHRLDYRIDRFLDEPPGHGETVAGLGTWAELELPGLLVIGLSGGGALEIDGRAGKEPLGDAALIALAELLLDRGR